MAVRCAREVPDAVLQRLHPAEYMYAAMRVGAPRRDWVAGRQCLAAALRPYTEEGVPLLVRRSGAAVTPAGMAGSISHKTCVTVAVATRKFVGIGVDLEYVDGDEEALAGKVLTVEERYKLEEVGTAQRAAFVTAHFLLKEALYKAADESDQEGMEFQDIELELTSGAVEGRAVWMEVKARVANSRWESQGFVLRDGRWILAVASRAEGR